MKAEKASELYLVEVQPLLRGLRENSITYFSSEPYTPGSVIQVPFRTKERSAIVLSIRLVADAKAELKTIRFALKKITEQTERSLFSPALLAVASGLADYYATSSGEVLRALVPSSILESELVSRTSAHESSLPVRRRSKSFVQGDVRHRIESYSKLIRKTLKRGASTLILVPTIEDARSLTSSLGEEFGEEVFELSSSLSKKKQVETWRSVLEYPKAKVVVMTSGFLSLPITNVELFIVDRVGSSQFIGLKKPYLDTRLVMKRLSKHQRGHLVLGDMLIPLSELGEVAEDTLSRLKKVDLKNKITLIDMTSSKIEEARALNAEGISKKEPFRIISPELFELTDSALKSNKKVFWFVARRGLFPSTTCRDCGAEHACEKCAATLVLHKKNDKRVFICHRCGHREETLVTCKVCGSWRLEPLGVGVDRVFTEAKERFGDAMIISADATNTKKKIRSVIKKFRAPDEGHLLIGTDLALPYLEPQVDLVGIVSLDSRLSLPLYNAEESALRTLLTLNSLAKESSLIQTRRPDSRVFMSKSGNELNRFRVEERKLRSAFKYPPYSTLINITFSKDKEGAEYLREMISNDLRALVDEGDQVSLPALRGTKKRGVYQATIILKLKRDLEENEPLREFMRSLPPGISVRVGPENLW